MSAMSESFHARLQQALATHQPKPTPPTLPTPERLAHASASLGPSASSLSQPLGTDGAINHLLDDIVPALSGQSGPRYFGFVTGGVHPAAAAADNIVTATDQNVQVHLPDATIATELEAVTLDMLADLLGLKDDIERAGGCRLFEGRTFTTGATASNVLGLACGRERVVARRLPDGSPSVGELGLLGACAAAGIRKIQVLTSAGHSSLSKAASIVGIGRASVVEMPCSKTKPWLLDLEAVETELKAGSENGTVTIIAISLGEVNTGRYAVDQWSEVKELSALSKKYGSWFHVDGAFGMFARALAPEPEFSKLRRRVEDMEKYVDSITVDGHKLLNVPYDSGMFFIRSLSTQTEVFKNPNAAYLASAAGALVPSPLNLGIENSRRFRALPAYAMLKAEGRDGIAQMLGRMASLARGVSAFLRDSEHYDWLPEEAGDIEDVFIIVLFRAKDETLNDELVAKINGTRDMYVSGTSWNGRKAVRLAVSNYGVDVARDLEVVTRILTDVAEGRSQVRKS